MQNDQNKININDLPDELLWNILKFVYNPYFKSVCKKWNRIMSDPYFQKYYDQLRKIISKKDQIEHFKSYKKWYENGNLRFFTEYNKLGQKHGWHLEYGSNGQLMTKSFYLCDTITGTKYSWCPNGYRKEYSYVDGRLHGVSRVFFGKTLIAEAYYIKGHINGKKRKWWPNGQLRYEASYSYGRKQRAQEWDKDGNVLYINIW